MTPNPDDNITLDFFFSFFFLAFSSPNLAWSSFKCKTILVPLSKVSELSGLMVNEPPAEDSQRYCLSSLGLECTTTSSATSPKSF